MQALVLRVKSWAASRHAVSLLAMMSFIEAIFFPVPPDVMLLPMMLVQPHRAWFFAAVTVLASLIGAVLAYALGALFSPTIQMWMLHLGFEHAFNQAKLWFDAWGVAAVIVAGFTPIPFKIFTLTAGILKMNLPFFIVASAIGRSLRFGMEAILIKTFGYLQPKQIKQVMIVLSWSMILVFCIFIVCKYYLYG